MARAKINPEILQWARTRAREPLSELTNKFKFYAEWERGDRKPTMRQLHQVAKKLKVPLGYFFLSRPPDDESVPLPDYRSKQNKGVVRPSPELLEIIYSMQRRQDWMRDYLIDKGVEPLSFVGSISEGLTHEEAATVIRKELQLDPSWASNSANWERALKNLREAIDHVGITVVRSGIVGNNTHRPLDVNEFRGFVLCDDFAPLIFINGKDSKAAQMFTLAHELVHVWIGSDGLFDLENLQPTPVKIEIYCNSIAAELLVPAKTIQSVWEEHSNERNKFNKLARRFKVSPIVIARRALDLDKINEYEFFDFYHEYVKEWRKNSQNNDGSGGDFYNTQNLRIGNRFANNVFRAVQDGSLLYRDAYRLTDLKASTFAKYGKRLGFNI